ncbi:MAG: hypothetical protein R6W78_16650 [Bacteroidales bacterium]
MENIKSAMDLKNTIQLLEIEQIASQQLLKEHFHATYDSFKPVNLLRSSIHDFTSSPIVFDNILASVMGLATGYISQRLIVGKSVNRYRKFIGYALRMGVTKLISKNSDTINSLGKSAFQGIFRRKKKTDTEATKS